MATLTGTQVKNTYDSILKLEDNDPLTGAKKKVTDGLGNQTPLSISTSEVKSSVNVEAQGFKTPTGTSTEILMADGSVNSAASLGDKNYIHNQGSALAIWTINHNLDKFPSVIVIDSANSNVVGEIDYLSSNSLTVTFSGAFSGTAYIN